MLILQPRHISFILLIGLLFSCGVHKQAWRDLEERIDALKVLPIEALYYDDDKDGVPDVLDQEYNSPANCPTDTKGISLDSDADGIPDCQDKEVYSPPGYQVDANGIALGQSKRIVDTEFANKVLGEKLAGQQSSISEGPFTYVPPEQYTLQLPLPEPSAYYQLPYKFIASAKTFDHVDAFIRSELEKAKFEVSLKYFLVKDQEGSQRGFAIITPIEVTDENAVRMDWWYPDYGKYQINGFYDLIQALQYTDIDYTRMMVILVTSAKAIDAPLERLGGEALRERLGKNYQGGLPNLEGLGIAGQRVDRFTKIQFLIYEFRNPFKRKTAKWQAQAAYSKHLIGAGLKGVLE